MGGEISGNGKINVHTSKLGRFRTYDGTGSAFHERRTRRRITPLFLQSKSQTKKMGTRTIADLGAVSLNSSRSKHDDDEATTLFQTLCQRGAMQDAPIGFNAGALSSATSNTLT